MIGIPPDKQRELLDALRRPRGTFAFTYHSADLLNPDSPPGALLGLVTGDIIMSIERDAKFRLVFVHSSPGTGTRQAMAELHTLAGGNALRIVLTWEPQGISLSCWSPSGSATPIVGQGEAAPFALRVGKGGAVFRVGDAAMTVGEYSVYEGGKPVLQSTAIEAWKGTADAIRIHLGSASPPEKIQEFIDTNLTLVMLVTGLETYCKRRFLELEGEGIKPNWERLRTKFFTGPERAKGVPQVMESEAKAEKKTVVSKLVESGRIDFQNFDRCKRAFGVGYGVRFGIDLSLPADHVAQVARIIGFRHQIIHVSPMIGILNPATTATENPVFPTRATAESSVRVVTGFIEALHAATLKLGRND